MRMAMTAHIRSTLVMRFAESSSASSIGRPRRDSVNTRCSSRRVGSAASFATDSRPWANEKPGSHRAGEQVQRVGELDLELAEALLAPAVQRGDREDGGGDDEDQREPEREQQDAEQRDHEHAGEVEEQRFGRTQRQVGLLERVFGARQQTGAVGEPAGEADHPLQDRGLGEDLVGT